MTKKTAYEISINLKEIAITACFLTVISPVPCNAADPKLIEANNNLQTIFKRIHKKYAEYDAQQAKLAAQNQISTLSPQNTNSHNVDASSGAFSDTTTNSVNSFTANTIDNLSDSRFMTGEELIMSVSLNGLELTSIFATKTSGGLQVGLGEFMQIIELPIYVNLDNNSAEGWYLNEKNRFTLKKEADGQLQILANNQHYKIAAQRYRLDDDFYVELDDLAQWLDLSYELNEEQLSIHISSKNKLPVEQRLARNNKGKITKNLHSKSVMPLQDANYRAFSPPMLDIQASTSQSEWLTPPNSNTANIGDKFYSQKFSNYSILANHDLAYLNSELFISGNDNKALDTAWLTFSRQSENANLLGPLGATEYALGDVVPFNGGIGSTQGLGRGFKLANTPINQLGDNRRVNISGPIQEGWDIELYRNGLLIDQRLGITEGRYDFNDIPLEYGNNDFELMLYGPQGQIESKKESYVVNSNTVSAGEGMYRFSLVEVGESVFGATQFTEDLTQKGILASSILDYGVTDWLALTAGATSFTPELGDSQDFISVGANANLGKAGLLSASFLQNQDELKSFGLSYRTRLFNTSYSLDARRSENPQNFAGDKRYIDQLNASMSGQLFSHSKLPLGFQNAWSRTENSDNTNTEYFQNSIGLGGRFGYITNNITWQKGGPKDGLLTLDTPISDEEVSGALQYRKNFGRLSTRLFSNYTLDPTKEISGYGSALNYSWSNNFNSEIKYSYFKLTDLYQVNLGLNWSKDAFYLSTNAGYSEDGSWSAGLTLRFSLGYEPMERSIFTSGRPMSQSGAVAVRVFEDLNMNGTFDENEPPMENATVQAVQAYRQEKTNAAGVAVLSSLYNNTTTDIVVDEATLDGPFMITANKGVAIKARKGFVDQVEIPVVKSGELEGIIYLQDTSGESAPAPYIMLNLVDKESAVVATTRSEFDGYYLFTKIKPGPYQLKVDESYTDRRGLKTSEKQLDFSSNGDVIAGIDFILHPLDEAHGYVASAGKFESANMLKLYYQILRNKLGNSFIQKPFYIKLPEKAGYILGLAYFEGNPVTGKKSEVNALNACSSLSTSDIYCDVQYHDFKY